MEASWKQSHTANKDEPPMHTFSPGFVIYFDLRWEKRHQVKVMVKKETELVHVSLREVTDNWQHPLDPETASPREMIEIGNGSERRKPIFVLRDWAQFRILQELKNSSWSRNWKPQNTQQEENGKEKSFIFLSSKYCCSRLPHHFRHSVKSCLALLLFSPIQKAWRPSWCRGRKSLEREVLSKCGKCHSFLYLHHSAHALWGVNKPQFHLFQMFGSFRYLSCRKPQCRGPEWGIRRVEGNEH